MVRVKVCGLREPEHALAAARLGADLLGLVFAPSRRQVSPQQARKIVDALALNLTPQPPLRRRRGGAGGEVTRPLLVGVFVNQPLEEVDRVASLCRLDYVQLHGDEPPEYCRSLVRPFIKALRLAPEAREEEMARRLDSYLAVSREALFLLDTHLPGIYGGSGRPWKWERAALLAQRYSVLIAGGLTPENVASVIRATCPWGVDVSSGVETNGTKDQSKIRAFIEAVRNGEEDFHDDPQTFLRGVQGKPLGKGF